MFFLYHRISRPTGRKIAQALGMPHYALNTAWARRRGHDLRRIVRWGNSEPIPEAEVEFNTAPGIRLAADKLASFTALRDAGVRVPDFTDNQNLASVWQANPGWDGERMIGRTRHGAKGHGIKVYEWDDDLALHPAHELYVTYVPNRREYRVHVCVGEVIRVQGKYLDFPEQAGDGYIKNHEHGYRFRAPRQRLKPEREEMAVRAVEALGLDFGAVDLVIGADDDLTYVLEVNTAPACSPMTAAAYVSRLAELIVARTDVNLTLDYDVLDMLGNNENEEVF